MCAAGLHATLWRDTPTFGVYFAVYEVVVDRTAKAMQPPDGCRTGVTQPDKSNRVVWTSQLVGGAAAGVACWSLALPMDVVKSVVQSTPLSDRAPSISAAISSVYQRAGLAGFWAGAAPCLIRSLPCNAVTFFVFEYIRESFARK